MPIVLASTLGRQSGEYALSEELSQLEREIAEALGAADARRVAVLTLRGYGSEILGFLMAQLRNDQHAEEVFSMFAEDLWRSLEGLQLRSSMRAYAYALARNAKHRYLARDLRKHRAWVPLSQAPDLALIAAEVRSTALSASSTPRAQRLAQLRAELAPEDQELLTLRIDREFEFAEIALITLGDPTADAARVARESARLRKRFQGLKERLRTRWAALSRDD